MYDLYYIYLFFNMNIFINIYTNFFFYYWTDRAFWLENLDRITINNPSICPRNCGRKFGGQYRKQNLKLHLLKECGISVNCPICMKKFVHKRSLKYHMAVVHKVIKYSENWNGLSDFLNSISKINNIQKKKLCNLCLLFI